MSKSARSGELRTVAIDEIAVEDGFNPREHFEHVELERLSRSIEAHGVLQPLVVSLAENGYRLVAGERRFRAAKKAGLEEVPVVVRDTGDASGLDLAVIENISREDLDPVEEARSYDRLMGERNLTRKGLAEHLGVAQKRVTERLQILDLPTELHTKVASSAIPPSAVKPLASLAKAHEELPAVAVACVETEPANEWEEPTTWADVVRDPVGVVLGHYGGGGVELPAGIYQGGAAYPVDRFDLSEKACADLDKLCKLLDRDPHELAVRFEYEELEQAEALNCLLRTANGYGAIVLGKSVADQLAGDYVGRMLKRQRQIVRQQRDWERRAQQNGDAPGTQAPPTEDEIKEQRRREREAADEERRQAVGHNLELGAAVIRGFAKVKLDTRVLKLLATLNLGGELDQLAMRGARYGFPGWVEQTTTKSGKPKTIHIEKKSDAGRKAREFLSVAKTPQEVAGRLLALIAMARYANESAVAQSSRSFYSLPVPRELPWAGEIADLIDELAAERLPDHLTAARREERAEQRKQEKEREALRASIAERLDRASELSEEERAELRSQLEEAYGKFSPQAYELTKKLDTLESDSPGGASAAEED